MDSTRISELPIQNEVNAPPQFISEPIKTRTENVLPNPSYKPIIDVHPNPYGIQKPNSPPDFSKMAPPNGYTLPAHDIPIDTADYTNDQQTQPNYIPKPKLTQKFINEYDESKKWEEHRKKKLRKSRFDLLMDELQTPLYLAFLFFLFQMPTFNSILFRYFSIFSIYNVDGNINFYGYLFKSILFGIVYLLSNKLIDFFSE